MVAPPQGFNVPVGLSLSNLLPPNEDNGWLAPSDLFPSPACAILGPLPPTSPIHLALNHISLSDLPEYKPFHHSNPNEEGNGTSSTQVGASTAPKEPGRVLIISGSESWAEDIEDEDEDWLRDGTGKYGMAQKLKRIDTRYCPTPSHLLLLLALLSTTSSTPYGVDTVYDLPVAPSLIILWDVARLFMRVKERQEENLPPGMDETDEPRNALAAAPELEFVPGVTASDYLDLIATAKGALHHFSSTATDHSTQLIILEPHLTSLSGLPILKPASVREQKGKLATPMREKKASLKDGLEWMLGSDAVGVAEQEAPDPDAEADDPTFHDLVLGNDVQKTYRMKRRHCPRAAWARPEPIEVDGEATEVDKGGWRWEWV